MMGERQVDQSALFYEFSFEKHVPVDHMLRSIDRSRPWRCPDAPGAVLQHNRTAVGRPGAADPDADHRLLLRHPLGTPAVRGGPFKPGLPVVLPGSAWRAKCRTIDLSKNRHGRFRASDLLRHIFEAVVRRCMAEGLVGGDGFAVDGSLIKADASRQKGVEGTRAWRQRYRAARSTSISRCWMTRRSAPRPR